MTQPLTGREIDWSKTQAEMRRQHHRRRGEINGPFSWGSVLNFFTWAVILAALFYVCFISGRWYEQAQKDTVHPASIATEYKDFRVRGH
jgi:hypothetical protein